MLQMHSLTNFYRAYWYACLQIEYYTKAKGRLWWRTNRTNCSIQEDCKQSALPCFKNTLETCSCNKMYWHIGHHYKLLNTPQVCFSLTDSNVKAIVKPHWDHYDAFDTIFRTEDHISRRLKHQDIPLLTPNSDREKRSRLCLPWRRKRQQSGMGGVRSGDEGTDQVWVVEDGESKLRKREWVFNWMSVVDSLPLRQRQLTQLCVKLRLNTWPTRSEWKHTHSHLNGYIVSKMKILS